jgi:hypothetical protein
MSRIWHFRDSKFKLNFLGPSTLAFSSPNQREFPTALVNVYPGCHRFFHARNANKYSDGLASGKNLWNQARYLTVLFDLPLTNQIVWNIVRKVKATPFNEWVFSNIL